VLLFSPRRRSSSPIRFFCAALSTSNAATRPYSAPFPPQARLRISAEAHCGFIPALSQVRSCGTGRFAWPESIRPSYAQRVERPRKGRNCAGGTCGTCGGHEQLQGIYQIYQAPGNLTASGGGSVFLSLGSAFDGSALRRCRGGGLLVPGVRQQHGL
jgi:hypothetical protein